MNYLEILATFFVLSSVVLAMFPKGLTNPISIIGQLLWIFYGIEKGLYFLAIQSIVILLTNIYGIYSWKKKGIPLI